MAEQQPRSWGPHVNSLRWDSEGHRVCERAQEESDMWLEAAQKEVVTI